ncbi:MAG TPA: tRNA (adenosine(37)-N6)-dimethylallyltransferase MiaA [Nitrospirota bacterium]|nr:tRNA (adenosine(37)-N6)-dimethylallyltransferase MiaA [Nitrospirota bacterium]
MPNLLIIVGPTAVGKTELALALAEEINAEIISADSMQVYRGMDIGTAKPTPDERARVPHHLIDVADPREEFSAGRYVKLAEEAIEDIRGRGKVPLVVGGTGLYVRSLVDGLFEGPGADRALRDELTERERREPGSLYAALKGFDPAAADRINPSDVRRIIRALEVYYTSGEPISARQAQWSSGQGRPAKVAGLRLARPALYRRIEERVDKMMRAGLLDEVRALKDMGCPRGSASMQALGYKQLMAHLDGETTLEEAVRLIKRDTKRYAKRQFTWFGADKRVTWVDMDGLKTPREALPDAKKALEIFGKLG